MAAFDKFVDHLKKQHKPIVRSGGGGTFAGFSSKYRWGAAYDEMPVLVADTVREESTYSQTYYPIPLVVSYCLDKCTSGVDNLFNGSAFSLWLPAIYAYKADPPDTRNHCGGFKVITHVGFPSFIWSADPATKGVTGRWAPVTPKNTDNIFMTNLIPLHSDELVFRLANVSDPKKILSTVNIPCPANEADVLALCKKYYAGYVA